MAGPSLHEAIRVAYETVEYVGRAFHETHPNRLLAVARLHGLDAKPSREVSMLEIASGDGANLLPIAAAYPQGRFVGVDRSARLHANARAMADGLGIPNVALLEADLRELPAEIGTFDVVMAHGLYSWVPGDVRDALMRAIARHLAPGGVAYLNYNLLPGAWLRRAGFDAMQFHVRRITDPGERVARAREFIALMVECWRTQPGAGAALAANFAREAERDDGGLFHDDLAPQNEAVYLLDFVRHARRHGLEVLGDLDPEARSPGTAGPALRERLAGRDPLAREQMLDFVRVRQMRQSLLVHPDAPRLASPGVAGLHFAASMPYMRLRLEGRAAAEPVGDLLAATFPGSLPAEALVESLRSRGATDAEAAAALRRAWTIGLADPYVEALAIATRPSEHPRASAVARWQAARVPLITNLRHVGVRLGDDLARAVLARCDGTRTASALAAELRASVPAAESGDPAAAVARRLAQLASASLFEA